MLFRSTRTFALNRPSDLPGTDLTGAFRREPIVMVDPGHGGTEIGSTAKYADGQLSEKELNLKVATRLTELLRAQGINAMMTRTTDTLVNKDRDLNGDDKINLTDDLQARVDKANEVQADLLIAVHFNGLDDPSRRGTQMFYADERPFSDRSKSLAEMVQNNMLKQLDRKSTRLNSSH